MKEAFRVLRKGSRAAFTIWGDPDQCIMFTIIDMVLANRKGTDYKKSLFSGKTNFDLYKDKGLQMVKDLKEIGFS